MDWKVGDIALCVSKSPKSRSVYNPSLKRLQVGSVYTVAVVITCWDSFVLVLTEVKSDHPSGGFRAEHFVKVTPPEADEFDREVIDQMTSQPAPVED